MKKLQQWGAVGALVLVLAGCSETGERTAAAASAGAIGAEAFPTSKHAAPVRVSLRAPRAFAGLPDRGELTRTDTARRVHREGAYAWHPVEMSEEHALNAITRGELVVRAPTGEPIRLSYQNHVEHPDGNWSWVGKDSKGRDAVITFGEHAVFGSIPHGSEDPLRLVHAAGRTWMLQTDRRAVASIDNTLTRPKNPDFMVPPDMQVVDPDRVAAAIAAEPSGSTTTTVDVVVGYTPGFVGLLGGDSQARTRLANLVDITNQGFTSSQIPARVRMVHAMLVEYPDNTANKTALQELTGYQSGSGAIPVPATLQPLRNARDQFGADLVSLVRRFNKATNDGCGIAWLLGGGRTTIDSSDAPFGYSVVSDSVGNLFPDGGYICRDETFAHELGHNLGSQHDKTTATNDSGTVTYGAYTYSFGLKTDASAGNFYTIMAYGDSGQVKNRVFSNPRISICGGAANLSCGIPDEADNARSITNTVGLIASFRATVVPETSAKAIRNDLDGDGKSDIVWRNPGLELQAHWLMNGRQRTAESVRAVSSIYRIIGTGDFDGDRRTDLLWTNASNDLLWIWRSTGVNNYEVQLLSGYPAGWAVEGIVDVNADGRSDLVWRNAGINRFDVWLLNGPNIVGTSPANTTAGQRIIGTGDFNGDGYGDVLWTNAANDSLWIWRGVGNGQFGIHFLANYPAGWSVRGVTDLNADGRSDLVWQNPSIGLVDYWWLGGTNGTSIIGSGGQPVGSIYRVIATGDFDADGRGDLLWTNDSNDLLWVWRSQGNGQYISELVDGYPPGWSVMNGGS
jgi:hypothetical protein